MKQKKRGRPEANPPIVKSLCDVVFRRQLPWIDLGALCRIPYRSSAMHFCILRLEENRLRLEGTRRHYR